MHRQITVLHRIVSENKTEIRSIIMPTAQISITADTVKIRITAVIINMQNKTAADSGRREVAPNANAGFEEAVKKYFKIEEGTQFICDAFKSSMSQYLQPVDGMLEFDEVKSALTDAGYKVDN